LDQFLTRPGVAALPASIAVIKVECLDWLCLYCVALVDQARERSHSIVTVELTEGRGWRVRGANGGSSTYPDDWPLDFLFNIGGSPAYFKVAGPVVGASASSVERIHVRFGDGSSLTDAVDDRWVAMLSDSGRPPPYEIQLLGDEGRVLWSTTVQATDRSPSPPPSST
jgi:hypothetical protein